MVDPVAVGDLASTFTLPLPDRHRVESRRGPARAEHGSGMRRRTAPLLCELHAHTTWSDGALGVRELVDLYGRQGFDVLAVTDHTYPAGWSAVGVDQRTWRAYANEIEGEAVRARSLYDLLVLPGLELTWNEEAAERSAHAVVLGLPSFAGVAQGLEAGLARARAGGAAVIAAHPYAVGDPRSSRRGTEGWAAGDGALRELAHRFELINRHDVFTWVAEARLPVLATGDFHRLEHFASWKTLLPCEREAGAVLDYLRSPRPAYLVRVEEPAVRPLAA